MTTTSWLLATLENIGALNHQNGKLDVLSLYPHIETMIPIAQSLAEQVLPSTIHTIASASDPFSIALTQLVVFHIKARYPKTCCPKMVYSETTIDEVHQIPSEFMHFVSGCRVLVIQGILTDDRTMETHILVDLIRKGGGQVIGIATLSNQNKFQSGDFGVPMIVSLL